MNPIERVSPHEARERVQSGEAILVCAYDDDKKYASMRLDGSLSLSQLRSRISRISKDQEIIFF